MPGVFEGRCQFRCESRACATLTPLPDEYPGSVAVQAQIRPSGSRRLLQMPGPAVIAAVHERPGLLIGEVLRGQAHDISSRTSLI